MISLHKAFKSFCQFKLLVIRHLKTFVFTILISIPWGLVEAALLTWEDFCFTVSRLLAPVSPDGVLLVIVRLRGRAVVVVLLWWLVWNLIVIAWDLRWEGHEVAMVLMPVIRSIHHVPRPIYWLYLVNFWLKLVIFDLIELRAASGRQRLHLWQIYLLPIARLERWPRCYLAGVLGGHVASFGISLLELYRAAVLVVVRFWLPEIRAD